MEEAERSLRLDPETLISLMEIFFSSREEYLLPLSRAVESSDFLAVKKESHRLKGAAKNLRIDGIGDLALRMEQCAEASQGDELSRQYALIEAAFRHGQEELGRLKADS